MYTEVNLAMMGVCWKTLPSIFLIETIHERNVIIVFVKLTTSISMNLTVFVYLFLFTLYFEQIHPHDEEALRYNNVENGGGKKTKAVLQDRINKPLQEIYLTRMVRSKVRIS